MTANTLSLLSDFLTGNVVLLGFGNRLWSDDGAGSHAAEALSIVPGLTAIDAGFTQENYLEKVIRLEPA
jgi:Ni,Fe-hydrogenase maturation factor